MRARLALLLFVFCFSVHADTQTTVGNWTANLLTTVLSARYDDTPSSIEELRKNFLPQAWVPMIQFLRDKRVQINEQKLILHPTAINSPHVEESQLCGISPCWQIAQTYDVPELSLRLAFLLQVIPGQVAKNPHNEFVVQSMSLIINPMPPQ